MLIGLDVGLTNARVAIYRADGIVRHPESVFFVVHTSHVQKLIASPLLVGNSRQRGRNPNCPGLCDCPRGWLIECS